MNVENVLIENSVGVKISNTDDLYGVNNINLSKKINSWTLPHLFIIKTELMRKKCVCSSNEPFFSSKRWVSGYQIVMWKNKTFLTLMLFFVQCKIT